MQYRMKSLFKEITFTFTVPHKGLKNFLLHPVILGNEMSQITRQSILQYYVTLLVCMFLVVNHT